MAALVLTAGAKPIFLSSNYLTRHADDENDLTLSSGTALRHRLYDMDPASLWQGDNASDAVDETATFGLWQPGFQGSRDVDFLAVLGHNLLAFDIELSNDNGASYPAANKQAYTALAASYKVSSLASTIAANKIKLTAHTTQTANAYKQIGSIVIAKGTLQVAVGMSLFKRLPPRARTRDAEMSDGSLRRAYIGRSDASYHFNDFAVGFTGLTETQADALMDVLLDPALFIFYPEPGDRPKNMYLGQAVPNTVIRDYMYKSKSGGEFITFDFRESGGA